jgi:transcriptional regulator with XRE-family HTH domain
MERTMVQTPAPLSVISVIATSLHRERRRAGLSLAELARRAGVAKSTLSQLESGTGNPSVETLWALCVALDVTFAQLVEPPEPKMHVIRAGEGPVIPAEHANYVAKVLSACPPNARRDLYIVTAEPGTPHDSAPHRSGTYEHVVLCTGRARTGVLDSPVEISPGDYVGYPADVPHMFEALEPGTMAVVVSESV